MDPTIELPCYLSKVTPVPAAHAPALFDRWCSAVTGGGATSTAVTAADGELLVDDGSLERHSSPGLTYPYRRIRGRLQFRPTLLRDVDIELELTPWSTTHSELGLRYAGRRGPGARRRSRYHALGLHVLDVVSESLVWYHARGNELDEWVIVAA